MAAYRMVEETRGQKTRNLSSAASLRSGHRLERVEGGNRQDDSFVTHWWNMVEPTLPVLAGGGPEMDSGTTTGSVRGLAAETTEFEQDDRLG